MFILFARMKHEKKIIPVTFHQIVQYEYESGMFLLLRTEK